MNERSQGEASEMSKKISKLAFWTIIVVAVLMLISMILHLMNIQAMLVGWMQAVGALILFIISAIVGWQYCRKLNWFVQLLFFISAAVILVSVLLPQIF